MKPAAHLVWILVLAIVLPACSDKSRRISPSEALQYKQKLLRENPGEISPARYNEFGMLPLPTRGEIDAAFEKYRAEYAAEKARARAEFEAGRKASGDAPEDGSSPQEP